MEKKKRKRRNYIEYKKIIFDLKFELSIIKVNIIMEFTQKWLLKQNYIRYLMRYNNIIKILAVTSNEI